MTSPDRHYPAADSNLISSAHAFIDSEKSIPPDGQGLFGERLAGRNATSGQRNPQTEKYAAEVNAPPSPCACVCRCNLRSYVVASCRASTEELSCSSSPWDLSEENKEMTFFTPFFMLFPTTFET